jgi:hypothetical protein
MLTLSQGAWLQGGYNTLYGMSAGLGVNLTQKYPLNIMKEGLVTLRTLCCMSLCSHINLKVRTIIMTMRKKVLYS